MGENRRNRSVLTIDHFSRLRQSGATANFGDHAHGQIWGPNVNNNIYILICEYSSTGFEQRLVFGIVKFGEPKVEFRHFGAEI